MFQFAQFALLTEMMAVFATYILGYIGSRKMNTFLAGLGVSGLTTIIYLHKFTFLRITPRNAVR